MIRTVCLGMLIGSTSFAQVQIYGPPELAGAAGDYYGPGVAVTGDITGDGRPDFVISAPRAASATGYVAVYSGANGMLHIKLWGKGMVDYFGETLTVGDVDGDGFDDLVIGAEVGGASGPGRVDVYSGKSIAGGNPVLIASQSGPGGNTNFGRGLYAKDLDGDGLAEIVVGQDSGPSNTPGPVRVYRIMGDAFVTVLTIQNEDSHFGLKISSADVDGDSVDEILVASLLPGAAGRVFVYDFPSGILLGGPLSGNVGSNDYFANHITSCGDLNGDGCEDFVIGAPSDSTNGTQGGAVYVFSGKTFQLLGPPLLAENAYDQFGTGVVSAGDLDGDGIQDLAISASGATGAVEPRYVRLVSGATLVTIGTITGPTAIGVFGSLAGGADLNGDGCLDLVIGASSMDAAFVYTQLTGQPCSPVCARLSLVPGRRNCVLLVVDSPVPFAAIEAALSYESNRIKPVEIRKGPDFPESKDNIVIWNGMPENQCHPEDRSSGGLTMAAFASQSTKAVFPKGNSRILEICFKRVGDGPAIQCSPLRFVSCLGVAGAQVRNVIGSPDGETICTETLDEGTEICAVAHFVRGDANSDGIHDISDAVMVLSYLFLGDSEVTCLDAADANDDGSIDIADPIYLLSWRFLGGTPPQDPHLACGLDPTDDVLGCDRYKHCE